MLLRFTYWRVGSASRVLPLLHWLSSRRRPSGVEAHGLYFAIHVDKTLGAQPAPTQAREKSPVTSGYDIELRPGGRDITVTSSNVHEYVADVLEAIIGKGAAPAAKAFRDGFSKVFPISDLQALSADELVMLFGNSDEDWSIETLSEALKAVHGFNAESRAIRDLMEIFSMRRSCLQFLTGSPKLPIGGTYHNLIVSSRRQ